MQIFVAISSQPQHVDQQFFPRLRHFASRLVDSLSAEFPSRCQRSSRCFVLNPPSSKRNIGFRSPLQLITTFFIINPGARFTNDFLPAVQIRWTFALL